MHSFCARYYLLRPGTSTRLVLIVMTVYVVSSLDSLNDSN